MRNEISTMNPLIFWIVLLGAGGVSLALTMGSSKDVVEGAFITAIFWLGTFTLAWLRWVGTGGRWIARTGAGLIAAVIFWTAYRDLGRTDVFMCGCKGAASTFWPLVFLWLGGLGVIAFIISLSFKGFLALFKAVSFRSVVWWLFIAAWTGVCIYIFVRNINADVLQESLRGAGLFILVPSGIIAALIAVGYVLGYPSRRRNKAMLAEFEKFDKTWKQNIVELVDSNARRGDFLLCYQRSGNVAKNDDNTMIAQIGGNPLSLADEQWPLQEDGSPALFLLQVPLTASSLPAPWQERIISVYMQDWGLLVRSYAKSDLKQLTPKINPLDEEKVEFAHLSVIALPYIKPTKPDDDEDFDYPGVDTEQLLEGQPELQARLQPFTKHPAKALAWILTEGKSSSVDCLYEMGIQVGGNPYYIQNEHGAHCEICGKPMRFLFQFDDAFGPDFLLGDAGLGYVYGCDAHPEHCQGFVDCY